MTTPAQNPSTALAGGKLGYSLSSLALNCLASDRLAVAAWLALFLLAARLDANDQLLMESPTTPLLQSGGQEPAPVAHTARHFTGNRV